MGGLKRDEGVVRELGQDVAGLAEDLAGAARLPSLRSLTSA